MTRPISPKPAHPFAESAYKRDERTDIQLIRIDMRIDPQTKAIIARAAKLQNASVSEYIGRALDRLTIFCVREF